MLDAEIHLINSVYIYECRNVSIHDHPTIQRTMQAHPSSSSSSSHIGPLSIIKLLIGLLIILSTQNNRILYQSHTTALFTSDPSAGQTASAVTGHQGTPGVAAQTIAATSPHLDSTQRHEPHDHHEPAISMHCYDPDIPTATVVCDLNFVGSSSTGIIIHVQR